MNTENIAATSTEELAKRKQELLAQIEAAGEEVHAINQELHGRNMLAMAEKKKAEFLKANGVEAE
jgi:hypothetical protein